MRPGSRVRSLALVACLVPAPWASADAPPADALDSGVVSAWSDLLYTAIQTSHLFPPQASRVIGYFGVTLHEAVAPGRKGGLSLAGQLNGLESVPRPDPVLDYDWRIVANAAAASFLSQEFAAASQTLAASQQTLATPQQRLAASRQTLAASQQTLAAAEELRVTQLEALSEGLPDALVRRSEAHGVAVADGVLAWARRDGFVRIDECAFTPRKGEGLWVPTPLDLRRALQPCWCELRPFVLESGAACAPPPPTPYSADPTSQFMREAREVKDAVDHITPEQRDIALYWADDRSVTGTPAGHWMALVAQVSREREISLATACEAHARVGIALADAFISCWNTKFAHSYIRPVTVIQKSMDRSWLPLLMTPPFPEYTSGHSVASAAAAHELTVVFGTAPYVDHTSDATGLKSRSFGSFDEAAREAAMSRLYGGIHFRPAIEHGLAQGKCVARTLDAKLRFVAPTTD